MATKKKPKLKSERKFLEKSYYSDSYYNLEISKENGYTSLKLSDCEKSINWQFGKPGSERAIAKAKALKTLFDKLYNYLNEGKDESV